MNSAEIYHHQLKNALKKVSTPEKAASARRYFPDGINCIGATSPDIKLVIKKFQVEHADLTAEETLSVTEYMLAQAEFSEEIMVAYGLINKFVKKNYGDDLLLRFEYWLENYATNWALVDDLCMKTVYLFMMARPHLIENTQRWAYSDVSWCRRGSNVAWVKFVKRKIGKQTYYLDKSLIFKNCDLLIGDKNPFVQKSVGWLLKATSLHHFQDVVEYLTSNFKQMERATIRYAIEKMDADTRKKILSLKA